MEVLLRLFILISVQHMARALLTCQQMNVDECLKPFKEDFDAGIEPLKKANEETQAQACWKYQLISKCLVPIVYYCPEIKANLQTKLENFEYFCANVPHKSDDGWPFKPTFKPNEGDELIKEAEDSLKRKKTIDSAIKAIIAAAVTVFLILICVAADCISKCKIRRMVKKAVDASKAAQAEQQAEKLLQKEEQDAEDVEVTSAKKV